MTKLTSHKRNSLPASEFALPETRKYPVEDRSHAANAKSRASEAEHEGRISPSTEHKIDRKADKVLHGYGR